MKIAILTNKQSPNANRGAGLRAPKPYRALVAAGNGENCAEALCFGARRSKSAGGRLHGHTNCVKPPSRNASRKLRQNLP